MLLNSVIPTVISAWKRKTKKAASDRGVPSQMGDSAGTATIMGLDSEQRHSYMAALAASAVYDITQFFLRIARLFY